MLRFLLRIFFPLLFPIASYSQQDSLYEIKGLPTKEVYDLMFDSKGFLWIGHEFGLSRYDGNKFTHFTSPLQNSLAVSNIMEDNKGRIWCRNFTSQIFYIENNQMNLLSQYEHEKERRIPSMVIINNKLLSNSNNGIFVLNLADFTSKFIGCGKFEITSLSVWKNKIIAYSQGDLKFYFYDPESKNNTASPIPIDQSISMLNDYVLQNFTFNDTIYSFSSRTSIITKLVYSGGKIHAAGALKDLGFMNTINSSSTELWLHTSRLSSSLDGKEIIEGHNLSDLVRDKEGNTWVSSLSEGLLVKYNTYWKSLPLRFLKPNELIMKADNNGLVTVYVTNLHNIHVVENSTGKMHSTKIPDTNGPVQFLKIFNSNRVIISVKTHMYFLNLSDIKLSIPLENYYFFSAKCAVEVDSAIYAATANGLFKITNTPDQYGNDYSAHWLNLMRARWVDYNSGTKRLLIAFKDGLCEYRDNKLIPLTYNNAEIPALYILSVKDKTYISTYSSGVFLLHGERISRLNLQNETRPVVKMIARNDSVWMLGADYINVINSTTDQPISKIVIPKLPDAAIYDMAFLNNKVCLLTSKGTFTINSYNQKKPALVNYITSISVNGKPLQPVQGIRLAPSENNVEIELSTPFYTHPEKLYYKYRFIGHPSEPWINGEFGQNKFLFSSLQKGRYRFEALAVHPQFGEASEPVTFSFTVKSAWFESAAFKFFFSLLIATAVILPMVMFFRYRLRQQKLTYEKQLAIQQERERISEEIHDDIGAGLSGLRLYTELASNKLDNPDTKSTMNTIYSSITELSSKMQDVIWSLNTRNDTLENLLRYIQKQSYKLFGNSNIKVVIELPPEIPHIHLLSDSRADIYLMVKEALHNALKHSGAHRVTVDFIIQQRHLTIRISDNGNGYTEPVQAGNGMLNMQKRIQRLGGTMKITIENGVTLDFIVPLQQKQKRKTA
jgi:signal transduction histidine kinase